LTQGDTPRIFDTPTQKIFTVPQGFAVASAKAITPDGNRLVGGYDDGTVRIFAVDGTLKPKSSTLAVLASRNYRFRLTHD
jgi:hypothetical protein